MKARTGKGSKKAEARTIGVLKAQEEAIASEEEEGEEGGQEERMSELEEIKAEIRGTKAKLKKAEKDGRSEAYLIILQKSLLQLRNEASRLGAPDISARRVPKDRVSLSSSSRGSANNTRKLLAQLQAYASDGDSALYLGGNLVASLDYFDYSELPELSVDDLVKLAGANPMTPKAFNKLLQQTKSVGILQGETEEALQNSLSGLYRTLDTHKSPGAAVEFLPPREFSSGTVVFSNTGKAGGTSTIRRMVFEVKSKGFEEALLLQMLERLACIDASHLLKNALVFGATPANAFVFISKRSIPTSREASNVKSLHLFRTTHDKILKLWVRSSQCSPDSFLTRDAAFVIHALEQMNLDPWLCRVHLCGWSQSRVYDITLPTRIQWPRNSNFGHPYEQIDAGKQGNSCIGVVAHAETFVLKVVTDSAAFGREKTALDAINPSFLLGSISFHDEPRLEVGPGKDVVTKAMRNVQKNRSQQLSSPDGRGWWSNLPSAPTTGGVVVMKFGERPPDNPTLDMRLKMFTDSLKCLWEMHKKRFYHTDIRLANILRFGEDFTLIDFGEAVPASCSVVNLEEFSEGRKKLLPVRHAMKSEVTWEELIDVEMLARACFDVSSSTWSGGLGKRVWEEVSAENGRQRRRK